MVAKDLNKNSTYEFHIALDGNGLNGLEGRAGVCVFRYDPTTDAHSYDVKYYDGMAGGHAVSISPSRKIGFLGNTAQQLMFYDTQTLEEITRISTLQFEETDSSIKSSTHAVWLNDNEMIVTIGEGLWQINITCPEKTFRLGDHGLKVPHALKMTASKRYLVYGGMDHPTRGEACEVGIFDRETNAVTKVVLPTTCWHVLRHPTEDRFFALSFRVSPQEGGNYHEWSIAQYKEYVYEIDASSGKVTRHWAASSDINAHINSDVCISDEELIYCNGASATIVMINREDFSSYRILDVKPNFLTRLKATRQRVRTFVDCLSRGSIFTYGHQHLRALRVSRGTVLDSVYACQLSRDQKLLFTANRGLNTITAYRYPDNTVLCTVRLPDLQKYDKSMHWWEDPRLGFHHGVLVSP